MALAGNWRLKRSRSWKWLVPLLLASLYIWAHYHSSENDLEVSQTDLTSLTDAVLLQKRPLVITDRVHRHLDLIRLSAFRLLHVWAASPSTCTHIESQGESRTTARFTLFTQAHSDMTGVEIRHPVSQVGALIILRRHQTLVLPPRWRYRCPHGANVYELYDCASLALRLTGVSRQPSPATRSGISH